MSYEKRLALFVTLGIAMPFLVILLVNCTRPLSISNLPASERDAIRSIESLNINVSCGEFGCDFRARGRIALSSDTDDGLCHVVEFELLPTAVIPVGVKHNIPEETHRKLVKALAELRYLQRVVLPDASKTNIAKLHGQLPDCAVLSHYSDLRPYSAKAEFTSVAGGI